MSDEMLKLVIGGVLLVHGLGHGGALGALLWIRLRPRSSTGDWSAARTWLMPALPAETAATLASAFWVAALVGFVMAALSFWGLVLPADVWRSVAVDVAVFVAIWLQWPPQSVLGG